MRHFGWLLLHRPKSADGTFPPAWENPPPWTLQWLQDELLGGSGILWIWVGYG
jgi:hypothetical protein